MMQHEQQYQLLYEESNLSTHSDNIEHRELIGMDNDMKNLRPIAQKPNTLPRKHTKWFCKATKPKENNIYSDCVPRSSSTAIVVKVGATRVEKYFCVKYRTLKKCITPTDYSSFESPRGLCLVPLTKTDELYAKCLHQVFLPFRLYA